MHKDIVFKHINNILWNDFIRNISFFSKYKEIEEFAIKNNLSGTIYDYRFPTKNKCQLKIVASYDGIIVSLYLEQNEYKMGYENTPRQLYEKADEIHHLMIKNKLLYSPQVTTEFISELNQIKVNEVVDFNTRLSVICMENSKDRLVFKKQFEGKLDSLKISDFANSETYIINKHIREGYQDLFSLSYDYRSSTCNIRRRFHSTKDGYDILNEIESTLNQNDVISKNVGCIHLKGIKKEDFCIWFDDDNTRIERDTVASLLSWARNVNVEYNVVELSNTFIPISNSIQTQVNNTYLQKIKECSDDLNKVIDLSFAFNNLVNYSSISVSGFDEDETHNFGNCTFVFAQNRIIKLEYYDGSFHGNNIKSFGEVSRTEFISFMEKKRANVIKEINIECNQEYDTFIKMHPNFSKEECEEFLKHIVAKKLSVGKNVYGLSEQTVNSLDLVAKKLVSNYLYDIGNSHFSVKDLFNQEPDGDVLEKSEEGEIEDDQELF